MLDINVFLTLPKLNCVKLEVTARRTAKAPNRSLNRIINFKVVDGYAEQTRFYGLAVDPSGAKVIMLTAVRGETLYRFAAAFRTGMLTAGHTYFCRL